MATESRANLPRVVTVKELSEYLRVHPSTIYKLVRRGELPGFRIGTDWRFNLDVLDNWYLKRSLRETQADGASEQRNHKAVGGHQRSIRDKP